MVCPPSKHSGARWARSCVSTFPSQFGARHISYSRPCISSRNDDLRFERIFNTNNIDGMFVSCNRAVTSPRTTYNQFNSVTDIHREGSRQNAGAHIGPANKTDWITRCIFSTALTGGYKTGVGSSLHWCGSDDSRKCDRVRGFNQYTWVVVARAAVIVFIIDIQSDFSLIPHIISWSSTTKIESH